MMLVETFVGPSEIEGVGIFAASFIPAGTLIWRFDPTFDRLIARQDMGSLPPPLHSLVTKYGYPHHEQPDLFVLEIDNGRFMNHADLPNTDFTAQIKAYALRDIEPGEEITCNYREFDPAFELLPSHVAQLLKPRRRVAKTPARVRPRRRREPVVIPAG